MPFPTSSVVAIRRYADADAEATLAVFREAILSGAAERYSEPQRLVWSRAALGFTEWRRDRHLRTTWVAERRGAVVGFADLTDEGEVGMLYVHPDHTRQGVGRALLDEVEQQARARDLLGLRTAASLVAEPLFARHGFVVVRRQTVELRGERLPYAVMEKVLEPA